MKIVLAAVVVAAIAALGAGSALLYRSHVQNEERIARGREVIAEYQEAGRRAAICEKKYGVKPMKYDEATGCCKGEICAPYPGD